MPWWLKTCVGKIFLKFIGLLLSLFSLNRIDCLILDLCTSINPGKGFAQFTNASQQENANFLPGKSSFGPKWFDWAASEGSVGIWWLGQRGGDWPIGAEQRLLLTKNSADFSHKQQTQEFHISWFCSISKKNISYAIVRRPACVSGHLKSKMW